MKTKTNATAGQQLPLLVAYDVTSTVLKSQSQQPDDHGLALHACFLWLASGRRTPHRTGCQILVTCRTRPPQVARALGAVPTALQYPQQTLLSCTGHPVVWLTAQQRLLRPCQAPCCCCCCWLCSLRWEPCAAHQPVTHRQQSLWRPGICGIINGCRPTSATCLCDNSLASQTPTGMFASSTEW